MGIIRGIIVFVLFFAGVGALAVGFGGETDIAIAAGGAVASAIFGIMLAFLVEGQINRIDRRLQTQNALLEEQNRILKHIAQQRRN